jgi:hypothetical protein
VGVAAHNTPMQLTALSSSKGRSLSYEPGQNVTRFRSTRPPAGHAAADGQSRYAASSMLTPTRLIAPAIALAAGLQGCDAPLCVAEPSPAIEVQVRDSVTGAPAAAGAWGIVKHGDYVDSLRAVPYQELTMVAAYEQAGVYDVFVYKRGYRDWMALRQSAASGSCHVRTVRLEALLVRMP